MKITMANPGATPNAFHEVDLVFALGPTGIILVDALFGRVQTKSASCAVERGQCKLRGNLDCRMRRA